MKPYDSLMKRRVFIGACREFGVIFLIKQNIFYQIKKHAEFEKSTFKKNLVS